MVRVREVEVTPPRSTSSGRSSPTEGSQERTTKYAPVVVFPKNYYPHTAFAFPFFPFPSPPFPLLRNSARSYAALTRPQLHDAHSRQECATSVELRGAAVSLLSFRPVR